MTRRAKLALFLVTATLATMLASAMAFAALLALYAVTISRFLPPEATVWAVGLSFVLSLAGVTFGYRKAIAFLRTRRNLDDILGPDRRAR